MLPGLNIAELGSKLMTAAGKKPAESDRPLPPRVAGSPGLATKEEATTTARSSSSSFGSRARDTYTPKYRSRTVSRSTLSSISTGVNSDSSVSPVKRGQKEVTVSTPPNGREDAAEDNIVQGQSIMGARTPSPEQSKSIYI